MILVVLFKRNLVPLEYRTPQEVEGEPNTWNSRTQSNTQVYQQWLKDTSVIWSWLLQSHYQAQDPCKGQRAEAHRESCLQNKKGAQCNRGDSESKAPRLSGVLVNITSWEQLAISCGGSIFTTEINKHYKSRLYFFFLESQFTSTPLFGRVDRLEEKKPWS